MESPSESDSASGLSRIGEHGLIEKIKTRAHRCDPRIIKSIGDDAAVFAASETSVATTDLLVQDVHFDLQRTVARLLGRKAMSVNLSDMAAMAAVPSFALLGLAAPAAFPVNTLEEILEGLMEKASSAGVSLIGGDVTGSDKLVMAIFLTGDAYPPAPVYRSGARVGDHIYVTGCIGDSGLGLARLLEMDTPIDMEKISSDPLHNPIMKHLDPEARLSAAGKIAGAATSMIDLSDGIASDLHRILQESNVPGACIELPRLPLSNVFREHFQAEESLSPQALQTALAAGEDYELLFTTPPAWNSDMSIKELDGVRITRIGSISDTPRIALVDGEGRSIEPPRTVFRHFANPCREEESTDV